MGHLRTVLGRSSLQFSNRLRFPMEPSVLAGKVEESKNHHHDSEKFMDGGDPKPHPFILPPTNNMFGWLQWTLAAITPDTGQIGGEVSIGRNPSSLIDHVVIVAGWTLLIFPASQADSRQQVSVISKVAIHDLHP